MRALTDGTNIELPSGDYPSGRVKDRVGSTPGTILNETIHGDLFQLLHKLLADAAIVPNGNPDNVTNGYQLMDALVAKIRDTGFRNKVDQAGTVAVTTVETTILTFVADAVKDSGDMQITFSSGLKHLNTGSNKSLTLRLKVAGGTVETYTYSVFDDNRNTGVNIDISGIAYSAGDVVTITGELDVDSCNFVDPKLIVNAR